MRKLGAERSSSLFKAPIASEPQFDHDNAAVDHHSLFPGADPGIFAHRDFLPPGTRQTASRPEHRPSACHRNKSAGHIARANQIRAAASLSKDMVADWESLMMKRWKLVTGGLAIGIASVTWNIPSAGAMDPARAQVRQEHHAARALREQTHTARFAAREEGHRGFGRGAPGVTPGCWHGINFFGRC